MKLELAEASAAYQSGSQRARVWTERWVADWLYCPSCGNPRLTQFAANLPAADFFCPSCNDQFELKAQKKAFGTKIVNGAYATLLDRVQSLRNPHLLLLGYDAMRGRVTELSVVPNRFFVPDVLERRKPLASTARRAGWIGSNILLNRIPESGRIFVIRDEVAAPKEAVLERWRRTLFLDQRNVDARSWLIEVMNCVEAIGRREFTLDEVYAFEHRLGAIYPRNRNVRPKIRQQLQALRDAGYLSFTARGRYRLTAGD